MSQISSRQVSKSLANAIALSALAIATCVNSDASAQVIKPASTANERSLLQNKSVIGQDVIGQNVTSVSQLSDVRPTDWAFTALQSLVERYGCIAGYPDRTFRGKQATSRYEFAAGLNACLDKINEIISAGLADKVSKEDLATLRKLQEEFASELATLRGRVDVLDAKTAKLEAQQFSTTTKLEGQAIVSIAASGSGSDNLVNPNGTLSGNSGKANTTVINRVRLNFNTSFTGEDLLLTRLEAGNGGATVANSLDGANNVFRGFSGLKSSSVADYSEVGNTFSLGRLRYDFPIGSDIRASVGSVIALNDHLDKNSFANDESVDFSSRMFINNPLILPVNDGAGAAITWNINRSAFTFRAGYVAANGASPNGALDPNGNPINQGLFGDAYQGTVELEFAPKNAENAAPFALRLQYTRASVNNLDYNIGGLNVEWAVNKAIAIFGRYGFGNISNRGTAIANALNTYINAGFTGDSISPQTWSAGFAFPDLFKEGATGAIAIGQPFIESKVGNATQTNLELFYRFPISTNISITPNLQFIFNPNNNSGNSTITIGTLRTVFTF
ncbi:carbohydrate porin [Pseudanabaena sp. FACHB-1998]|uniref:iron uptake porin n=1 Tax=Pseudanabaena sp. FACHB-1998 TaxID=2692858 RepID=UPI001680A878|nr:iron uptake porin [Pseudanabaena sp. FACHB-1998]MBD2178452.1 carbohydrate porin [Pseudanabaena sp. FACHB-1998]